MKKIMLAILIFAIACAVMACKSSTADQGGDAGNTTTEASESAATDAFVPMETHDNLSIELEEGQTGEVSPD